mgnify:CR=1 FL=1
MTGMGLLLIFIPLFTVGSQVSSQTYAHPKNLSDFFMLVLTYRESSICLLGVVASCLGTWRRLNKFGSEPDLAPLVAYTAACISGLGLTLVVVGFPEFVGSVWQEVGMDRSAGGAGERNYMALAILGSYVSFLSGYELNFFDRMLLQVSRKLGWTAKDEEPSVTTSPSPLPGAGGHASDEGRSS